MDKVHELKAFAKGISVLYVEDNTDLQEAISAYLKKIFDTVHVASNGKEGLEFFIEHRPKLVISDISMPYMNGIEMLKKIKTLNPSQTFIITSAYTESDYLIEAIKLGTSAYIIKPVDYEQMLDVLHSQTQRIAQEKELLSYHHHLEMLVESKVKAYQELEKARVEDYEKILIALVRLIEQRDSYTAGHSSRVAHYAQLIAQKMGYSAHDVQKLYQAGILHDIGKIATPDAILLKPDRLSDTEYALIKEHVVIAKMILNDIPLFAPLVPIIESHHEHFDGSGYPQGLKQDQIPPLARIMIVADAFDAMTTSRIYRHKKSVEEAIEELKNLSGAQFDPEVTQHACEVLSSLIIEDTISQLPHSKLEEERFVYFYRDSLTNLYNQKYLSLILLQNSQNYTYSYLFVFSIHNFSEYNHTQGWDEGDNLLKKCASLLSQAYEHNLLFRIHANDFIVLSKEPFQENLSFIAALNHLLKKELSYSIRHFDIQSLNIDSLHALESLMNLSCIP